MQKIAQTAQTGTPINWVYIDLRVNYKKPLKLFGLSSVRLFYFREAKPQQVVCF